MIDPRRTAVCHGLAGQLNLQDLDLMMHWCSTTYRSVSRDSTVECIWQTLVPQEAMHHPCLMHGLLALAVLDRASNATSTSTSTSTSTTNPGQSRDEHLRLAQRHQNLATSGLASLRRLETTTTSQSASNAIFALACIMIYYALAFPLLAGGSGPVYGSSSSTLDDLCVVFEQTRASIAVIAGVIDRVKVGDLRPLIRRDESRPKMPDTSRLAILSLRRLNTILGKNNNHETDIYDQTIHHLSSALERLAEGGEPTILAIRWIFHIPARFIELIRARRPFALVILAHFAVIMHSLRGHWWMGSWGMNVLGDIGQTLDVQWREHISWVIDATGFHMPM